ncbi:MAG: DUF4070 domain-containing protein [Gammaproteobacteria bacterium]
MCHPYRNILMVYPEFPATYWGMQYFLPLIGKKAIMPPLGLLTIAALTPASYSIRLVDLNCVPLNDDDIEWADIVCFSAMLPQKPSLLDTAGRCRRAGKLLVFGGPYPTACPAECTPHCDVLVLNEGEITWPMFLRDVEDGSYAALYTSDEKPDVSLTPVPHFTLLRVGDYGAIPIQFSRGCPFLCEFCDIIVMFGRKPRTKTPAQVLRELDAVYATGYRGMIFIVDDNFIGNKKAVKALLPELAAWNAGHGDPFFYGTEATINLADDRELLELMVAAKFLWVFIGIETPSEEGLKETRKVQNLKGSMLDRVRVVQGSGLLVFGGFIIGFDSDAEDIFERQIRFIEDAAIPNAMIGPIVALPGTPLYARMKSTGRLLEDDDAGGNRTVASGYTNVRTILPFDRLLDGHRRILESIYSAPAYFRRTLEALRRLPYPPALAQRRRRLGWLISVGLDSLVRAVRHQPTIGSALLRLITLARAIRQLSPEYRRASLQFTWDVLRRCPDQIGFVLPYVLMGYHYHKFTFEQVAPSLSNLVSAARSADHPTHAALSGNPSSPNAEAVPGDRVQHPVS